MEKGIGGVALVDRCRERVSGAGDHDLGIGALDEGTNLSQLFGVDCPRVEDVGPRRSISLAVSTARRSIVLPIPAASALCGISDGAVNFRSSRRFRWAICCNHSGCDPSVGWPAAYRSAESARARATLRKTSSQGTHRREGHAAASRPAIARKSAWLRKLRTPSTDPHQRALWMQQVRVVAAYRDFYGIESDLPVSSSG